MSDIMNTTKTGADALLGPENRLRSIRFGAWPVKTMLIQFLRQIQEQGKQHV